MSGGISETQHKMIEGSGRVPALATRTLPIELPAVVSAFHASVARGFSERIENGRPNAVQSFAVEVVSHRTEAHDREPGCHRAGSAEAGSCILQKHVLRLAGIHHSEKQKSEDHCSITHLIPKC